MELRPEYAFTEPRLDMEKPWLLRSSGYATEQPDVLQCGFL